MPPPLLSPLIRSHVSLLLLRRLSHSGDPRLGFVRRELEELQSVVPIHPPSPERRRYDGEASGGGVGGRGVEMSHPWPEWVELMERLLKRGYLDRSSAAAGSPSSSNSIRTACLNFARDHVELIRYFSRREIQIVVRSGCPSLDRKVVNSGKRLRSHVGIEEGDVCSSCNLRGSCDRAYVKAREDEGARTVDIVRILLTYGLHVITGSVENQACWIKAVKDSVRKLLNEVVDFSVKELDSNTPAVGSETSLSRMERSRSYQLPKGPNAVPMKHGDWLCPKCNFLNFAKNIKCLRCNGLFPERLKKLHEGCEHLPLKKGDWICEKCNFLNFAKNTKCLQCHEKPPKRQLNPGEWECVSCNYLNFRRNMVCLKCDWKRPKASAGADIVAETQHGKQGLDRHPGTKSIWNSGHSEGQPIFQRPSEDEDTDLWSSDEDRDDEDDLGPSHKFDKFDEFPIVGGKGATSQDPIARESWKEAMLRKNRGISERSREDNGDFSFASFCNKEMDECSDDDEIAGWFRYESGEGKGTAEDRCQ